MFLGIRIFLKGVEDFFVYFIVKNNRLIYSLNWELGVIEIDCVKVWEYLVLNLRSYSKQIDRKKT